MPVFVLDDALLGGRFASGPRTAFMLGCLAALDADLRDRGSGLVVRRGAPDGEPAQNNGNWQWVSSVGVDPKPYFQRMFNPVCQQRRFDPDGTYVRRWVPELRGVPGERLAEPWRMDDDEQRAAGCVLGTDYPWPIVDHAQEREHAIERYRAAG